MPVKNDEEFRAWLEEQPKAVCTAIAYRAAMRVLPLAALWRDHSKVGSRFALAAFRTSLISGVAAVGPAHDLKAAAYTAADAADAAASAGHAAYAAANAVTRAVARTADAATYAAGDAAARAAGTAADATKAADSAVDAVDAAASAVARAAARPPVARAARAVARGTVSAAAYADTDLASDIIMRSAIAVPPEVLDAIEAHAVGKTDILRAGGPWTFWAKWYDRAMAGDPLPWDLQEQIALIPSEVWEAGPEAVAEEIARIEEEFSGPPLDNAAAAREAQRLASVPTYFADIFDSASISVSYHVDLFLKKADLNTLPDGFQALDKVSASFASLAEVLRQSDDNVGQIAALKVELKAANAVIQELRRELRETRQALLSASHSPAEASRLRRLGQAALATIFTAGAFGGIASGIEAGFQLNDRRLASYEALRAEAEALAHTMESIEATDLEPKKPDT